MITSTYVICVLQMPEAFRNASHFVDTIEYTIFENASGIAFNHRTRDRMTPWKNGWRLPILHYIKETIYVSLTDTREDESTLFTLLCK